MLKFLWRLFKIVLFFVSVIALAITLFIFLAPAIGGKPNAKDLVRINQSDNHNGERFVNLIPTVVNTPDSDKPFKPMDMFRPPKGKNPAGPLPSLQFDKSNFKNGDFVWLGHSTILLRTADLTILIDPVFNSASPVQFMIKPFAMENQNRIEDLPPIDVVLISHDHYDHLDYGTIKDLSDKVGQFIVPLGIRSHLRKWGISEEKISDLDWYENSIVNNVEFVLAPSRHFSGRAVKRYRTLWGSWIVKSESLSMYFSGDSGYFDEFKKIGNTYGPFDIAFMENGAYNTNWNQIHLMPEKSVEASIDLKAERYFPIHWGKFDLSTHHWAEPIERATAAADETGVSMVLPRVGETFNLEDPPRWEWWK